MKSKSKSKSPNSFMSKRRSSISANKSTSKKRVSLRAVTPAAVLLRKKVEKLEFENQLLLKELTLTKEFAQSIEQQMKEEVRQVIDCMTNNNQYGQTDE